MLFRLFTVFAILYLAAFVVACGTSGGPSAGSNLPSTAGPGANAVVIRVVDGDTIVVRIGGGHQESVRLIGIDTPESVKPNTPVQCFALEASAQTKALLPASTPVRLERDVEARDRYGRLLAYVYHARDSLFVNAALARDGYAVLDTIPPNVAHVDQFVAAVDQAREADVGLWARCGDAIPHHPPPPAQVRSPP